MARKAKTISRHMLLPGRQWMSGAFIALLVGVSMVLFAMNRAENPAVIKLRTNIVDAVTPVLTVLSAPVETVRSAGAWVSEMVMLREENIRLRNENIQLMKLQAAAREMDVENRALRNMLHVVPARQQSFVTVRIVSDFSGPFVQAALVNGGASAGLKVDQAVITSDGLIGRIIEAGEHSARVLLLTDINSRIPVVTEKSREKSIMVGAGHDLPSLTYLAANSAVAVGERVVTSGDGGVFPAGIPVGVVVSVGNGVKVQPLANAAKATFVSAVDYRF